MIKSNIGVTNLVKGLTGTIQTKCGRYAHNILRVILLHLCSKLWRISSQNKISQSIRANNSIILHITQCLRFWIPMPKDSFKNFIGIVTFLILQWPGWRKLLISQVKYAKNAMLTSCLIMTLDMITKWVTHSIWKSNLAIAQINSSFLLIKKLVMKWKNCRDPSQKSSINYF